MNGQWLWDCDIKFAWWQHRAVGQGEVCSLLCLAHCLFSFYFVEIRPVVLANYTNAVERVIV